MAFAIRLNTPKFSPVLPTRDAWVWVFYNLKDWQPKALPVMASRFVTSDAAQAAIGKYDLGSHGAQIIDLGQLIGPQIAGQVPQEVAPPPQTPPIKLDPGYKPYSVAITYPTMVPAAPSGTGVIDLSLGTPQPMIGV